MNKTSRGMARYVPGAVLILSGLVIVAFPMLLVAFVSALLILSGILAITIAHKIKRFEDEAGRLGHSGPYEKPFWSHAERVFHRGRWH